MPATGLSPSAPIAARPAAARRDGRRIVLAYAGVVAAAAVVVGGVLAVVVAWWLGLVAVLLVGGAGWGGYLRPRLATAEARTLALVGSSRAAAPATEARLLNLVDGLAPSAGLSRPRCYVVEDAAPNAVAFGRDPRTGCVVFTSGLLSALNRMELEGVVAHCLVRLRDGATIPATIRLALSGGRRAGTSEDTAVDLAAVSLTRYPPGLSAALRTIATARERGAPDVPRASAPVLAPLWLVPPGGESTLADRIEALEEM